MQIKSLLFSLAATGSMAAGITPPFEAVAIAPGTGIHLKPIQAGRGGFYVKLPTIKATCAATSDETATLQILDDELFLYKSGKLTQRAYTDRSGMGHGILAYADDQGPLGGRLETKGWKISSAGNLVFSNNNNNFLACPGAVSGGWHLFVNVGESGPPGVQGCKPVDFRVIQSTKANSCTYTK